MTNEHNYENHVIRANRVPDAQFIYGGFGWAFEIHEANTDNFEFRIVIKSNLAGSEADIQHVYQIGLRTVGELIDDCPKQNEYCCWWSQEGGLQFDDCSNVSPGVTRAPLPRN